jgi:hypothetical protein
LSRQGTLKERERRRDPLMSLSTLFRAVVERAMPGPGLRQTVPKYIQFVAALMPHLSQVRGSRGGLEGV